MPSTDTPGDLTGPPVDTGAAAPAISRFLTWRKPLLSFILGQPAVQLLNLITGFFLIRWLDVMQYAMFGIAFAFQSLITQLADLGYSGSIVALAGERSHDPDVLGGYLRSARNWRLRTQSVVLVLAAIAFPLMTANQTWPPGMKPLLFSTIALGVIFQGWTMYGAPLLVHRSLAKYYLPQIQSAALRLAACAVLHFAGFLQAWQAALVAALALGYVGLQYKKSSRPHVREPAHSRPECDKEMWRYLAPLVPGLLFVAVQGQILVAVSSIFGSTRNIAEVSALGRIGQIFLILGAFNSVIIGPYIARVSRELLPRRLLQILGATTVLASGIAGLAFLFPGPLLWLLGKNYAGLHKEIGWVTLTACVNYVAGVFWTVASARRWIFWWGTAAYIGSLLAVQTVCIATMDLSQTLSVIYFGLITAVVTLLIQAANGIYGLTRPPSVAGAV